MPQDLSAQNGSSVLPCKKINLNLHRYRLEERTELSEICYVVVKALLKENDEIELL